MTSEQRRLIVPDTQLRRIDVPAIIVPKRPGRLFYFDEANVSWCPQSGRVYRVIGQEHKVNTPGRNQRKYLIGSIEYPTGAGLYEIYPRKRHIEIRHHWRNLIQMYPDAHLFVVRDNATSHTTAQLDEFLIENQDRFSLAPMPTYSPHLNLIEHLWHYMRDNITRSHFYGTFTDLCESLVRWLSTLSFQRFRSLLGIEAFT